MYRLEEADIARFWSQVDMLRHPGGCWPRGKGKTYAVFAKGPQGSQGRWLSHRLAYLLTFGPIDDGLLIDHTCHNPPCCNPAHLRVVTYKQNQENRDGATRGNKSSGLLGVTWCKRTQLWQSKVWHDGKCYNIGRFANLTDAEAAVIAKRNELFTHNDRDR